MPLRQAHRQDATPRLQTLQRVVCVDTKANISGKWFIALSSFFVHWQQLHRSDHIDNDVTIIFINGGGGKRTLTAEQPAKTYFFVLISKYWDNRVESAPPTIAAAAIYYSTETSYKASCCCWLFVYTHHVTTTNNNIVVIININRDEEGTERITSGGTYVLYICEK